MFLHFREVPTHLVCLLCLVFKGQRRLSRQLLYIIIGIFLCQQLFEIYFKFLFRNRFKSERSLTVFIIYHSFLYFASLFYNFFYIFDSNKKDCSLELQPFPIIAHFLKKLLFHRSQFYSYLLDVNYLV